MDSRAAGGLNWDSLPLKLFASGNAKFWNLDDLTEYHQMFYEELPVSLDALSSDPSPAAQVGASVTYNHIIEGTMALTGYYAWQRIFLIATFFPVCRSNKSNIGIAQRFRSCAPLHQ